MKNFIKLTIAKVILTLVLFILFVPTFPVPNHIQCIQVPCSSSPPESIVGRFMHIEKVSTFYLPPINIGNIPVNIIFGLVFFYIVSCALMMLSWKDFIVVISVGLLQLFSIIFVNALSDVTFIIAFSILIILMLSLAAGGFFWGGKRKRTLLFTLAFPVFFLLALIYIKLF